ncbi:elongation factor 1-beta [Candidatus Woesearchaeota archaeon]|nr:elongation factor 1-beta [Candidatus Woesearchaeota archaeon]MCF7900728.1 elongation factor 1-beta [Candidatus Woesearchaeota archaeon]MCF8013249.1 elongation factor 1-beta [Candidatus Woesearchaeota archaeon]
MAKAIATVKVMPDSPETSIEELEKKVKKVIYDFTGEEVETKTEIIPVAFGLKAISMIFVMDENLGSPDPVAEKLEELEEVNSAEIVDVRRALG